MSKFEIKETPEAGDGDTINTGGVDGFTLVLAFLALMLFEACVFVLSYSLAGK